MVREFINFRKIRGRLAAYTPHCHSHSERFCAVKYEETVSFKLEIDGTPLLSYQRILKPRVLHPNKRYSMPALNPRKDLIAIENSVNNNPNGVENTENSSVSTSLLRMGIHERASVAEKKDREK